MSHALTATISKWQVRSIRKCTQRPTDPSELLLWALVHQALVVILLLVIVSYCWQGNSQHHGYVCQSSIMGFFSGRDPDVSSAVHNKGQWGSPGLAIRKRLAKGAQCFIYGIYSDRTFLLIKMHMQIVVGYAKFHTLIAVCKLQIKSYPECIVGFLYLLGKWWE